MEEREALILLNCVTGLGPARIKTLATHIQPLASLFGMSAADLVALGLSEGTARSLLEAPRKNDLERELETAEKEGIRILHFLDEAYPKSLKEIHDPPVVLYVKGELPPGETLMLAIIGSRRASSYGLEMAEKFSRELVGYGFTVVSGFARGIDTAAHRGALSGKGKTIAVLGSGLLEIYPPENRGFAKEIFQSGALVSEFPLRYPALPQNFPQRNRVISGLSLGVLVVEADEKSGALITANFAVEQGREVFALPGRVDSALSKGTHRLIQQGAKLVQEVKDILEELKIPIASGVAGEFSTKIPPSLSGEEGVVYETLSDSPKSIDTIMEESHLSAPSALATLVQLEVKKLIRAYPGKRYARQ